MPHACVAQCTFTTIHMFRNRCFVGARSTTPTSQWSSSRRSQWGRVARSSCTASRVLLASSIVYITRRTCNLFRVSAPWPWGFRRYAHMPMRHWQVGSSMHKHKFAVPQVVESWRGLPQGISVRQATRSQSAVGGQGILSCLCKGDCLSGKCKCLKAGRKCTSRCHKKNASCCNK